MTSVPAGAGRRLRRALGRLGSLRSTRRTSLWELDARRPPAHEDLGDAPLSAVVVPPAEINRPGLVTLGERVLLHEGVSILIGPEAAGITIGAGTRLSRYAHISCTNRVTIGRDVSSSDHIAITDSWAPVQAPLPAPGHAASAADAHPPGGPVVIEDGAYLGFGCIVGPGVTVGEGAFVGEGAVVLDDVAAHSVVYGNPAQVVRRLTPSGWQGERFP